MEKIVNKNKSLRFEVVVLGGGCFWCLEGVYQEVRGVLKVESGYANGTTPNPTYEQVCSGQSGYAEVVQVTFDPEEIGLQEILEIFFVIHDPTTLNRQGNDTGTQYRSGIYFQTPEQEQLAQQMVQEVQAQLGKTVVTEVLPLENYATAEAEHQNYFVNHPYQGYCMAVVSNKVEKFRRTFARYRKA